MVKGPFPKACDQAQLLVQACNKSLWAKTAFQTINVIVMFFVSFSSFFHGIYHPERHPDFISFIQIRETWFNKISYNISTVGK